jgi:hypothetical protein
VLVMRRLRAVAPTVTVGTSAGRGGARPATVAASASGVVAVTPPPPPSSSSSGPLWQRWISDSGVAVAEPAGRGTTPVPATAPRAGGSGGTGTGGGANARHSVSRRQSGARKCSSRKSRGRGRK